VDVRDAATGNLLHSYEGTGGPYAIDHRAVTPNADGTRTLSFCYATSAENAAYDGSGVNVFLVDGAAQLNSGPVLFKRN
jgi:hypothetical protein